MRDSGAMSDSEVFVEAQDTAVKSSQSQITVRDMLKRLEDGDTKKQRNKRSRESLGSTSESGLLAKFDEMVNLIKQENQSHHETMVAEMKKELSCAVKEIETKLESVTERLNKRVADLESHIAERDDLIERLSDEVSNARVTIKKLEDAAEQREMSWKSPELILSGKAVPPAPRPGSASDDRPEDLRRTAGDVIRDAFPGAEVDRAQLADVRRIGARVLLCRFVHTGPGSLRHYLYENRLKLKGNRGDKELFINESLTPRKKEIYNKLLELKKAGRLYCVFSRHGSVCCKVTSVSQRVVIDSIRKVEELIQ